MNWIDAIIEMKKDNSKVFEFGGIKAKIKDGVLLQYHTSDGWQTRGIFTKEQSADWVEVKQFKEVDYAEFMEWYCNPNNKGKPYWTKVSPWNEFLKKSNTMENNPIHFLQFCEFQLENE